MKDLVGWFLVTIVAGFGLVVTGFWTWAIPVVCLGAWATSRYDSGSQRDLGD